MIIKETCARKENPSRYPRNPAGQLNYIFNGGARRLVPLEESLFEKKNKEGKKKRKNSNGNVIKTCTTNDAFLSSSTLEGGS